MLNKKYAQPLFMILMSLGMSVIMSAVVVAVNTGVSDGFFFRWGYSIMFASNCFNSSIYSRSFNEAFS